MELQDQALRLVDGGHTVADVAVWMGVHPARIEALVKEGIPHTRTYSVDTKSAVRAPKWRCPGCGGRCVTSFCVPCYSRRGKLFTDKSITEG